MTEDEQRILNKARENINAAQLLVNQGFINIAASRAYYAMFYLAEVLLLRHSLSFSSHSAVIAAFGKEFAKTGLIEPKFHQYLIQTQNIHQTNDYRFDESIRPERALQVIE